MVTGAMGALGGLNTASFISENEEDDLFRYNGGNGASPTQHIGPGDQSLILHL